MTKGMIAFIVVSMISMISVYFIYEAVGKTDSMIDKNNQQIIICEDITNKYNKCKIELESLKAELKELKKIQKFTSNDLDIILQNKIQYYIENNYQRVPKVLVKEIAFNIVSISREENIPPELTLAIIQTESSFNPLAVSKQNARGLMQIMPMWAKEFNVKLYDLHDIETNIRIGIKVLKIHMEENKGDLSQGLYYYVNKDKTYVDKVYKNMGLFISLSERIGDSNGVNK